MSPFQSILKVSKKKVTFVVLWVKYDQGEIIGCCMHHLKVVGYSVDQIWLKQDSSLTLDTWPLPFLSGNNYFLAVWTCTPNPSGTPPPNGNATFLAEYGHTYIKNELECCWMNVFFSRRQAHCHLVGAWHEQHYTEFLQYWYLKSGIL